MVGGLQGAVREAASAATDRAADAVAVSGAAARAVPTAGIRRTAVAEALRTARSTGRQTEILADRTDVSQTFADPDGSLTTSVSALPRWVKSGSSWVKADASLAKQSDGSYSPVAALGELSLSGGGSDLLATERSGSQSMSVTWPSPLPAPSVSGAAATYAGVFPGVNLVVTADVSGGFSETLAIEDKAAASDPGLQNLLLGVSASTGLSAHAGAGGTLTEENSSGNAVFFSPMPMAWDSAGTGASVSGPGGRGSHETEASAGYKAGSVRLGVPASLLAESAADFPVYVDPSYSVASTMLTHGMADSDYPTGFFWSTTEMGVGQSPSSGKQRSYFRMNIPTQLSGSTVQSASFTDIATNAGVATSTAHTVDLYSSGAISTSTTWDNQPSWGSSTSAAFTTASTAPNQSVSWNVATLVQNAVSADDTNWTLALVNSNESASADWVAFGDNPTISITYTGGTAGVPVGTGPVSNATFLDFPISDKVSLQVNVGSGDALVTTSDLSLPEISGALTLGVAYNSLLTGSGVTQGADGYGWRQSEGVDVRLYVNSDGAITFLGEDGTAGVFSAPPGGGSVYGSPPVFHATLTNAPTSACSGSTYQLTWHSTAEAMCFNSSGTLTSEADANGNTATYSYNSSGQETQITYTPEGLTSPTETVTATYTGSYLTGLSESGGSAGTKTITYTVDSSGDLTSVQQADGTTIKLGYDGSHDLTSIENGAGNTTALDYNSSGQVTSVSQPYGSSGATATTRLSYVSATETQVADPNTNQSDPVSSVPNTTYTLNAQDLVTSTVEEPSGDTRTTSYTPFNDVQTSTNGLSGGTTTNTYDANGGESLTSSEEPTGATAKLAYDTPATGGGPEYQYLPSSSTDAQGNATAYTYKGAGNLATATDATTAEAQVSYNADGTPATSTDPDGGATGYSYNSLDQLTKVTPPTSGSLKPITITYDGFGRVSTVTDGDGNTVTYTYDLADRITKEAYTGGSYPLTVIYAYDGAGNLKTQTDPSGTTTYAYDGRNQVLTKTATSGGGTLTYNYDADGNMISAQDAGGTTTYAYNDLNQLASLTDPTGVVWKFTYNAAGERMNTYFDTNSTETTWAAEQANSYDASGRITNIQGNGNSGAADLINNTSYCYNIAINGTTCSTSTSTDSSLLQDSIDNGGAASEVTNYDYDQGNRLTVIATDPGGVTGPGYEYDNDGDITDANGGVIIKYNTSNEITSSGYAYDADGNLTTDPNNGTLAYNDAGQLISASAAAGGGGGSGSETFTYAGASQDQPLSDGSATNITYGLASQYGQPWVDSYTTGGATDYIIRDQQGDPLGMVRGGQSYMFFTDDLGSVIAIAGTCGCDEATYTYVPYGEMGGMGSMASDNLIGYTGALTDTFTVGSTGYVHDGDRWYNPSTGTFISQDANSYLASPGEGNRYAYADDSPLSYIDPTGHGFLSCLGDTLEAAGAITAFGGAIFLSPETFGGSLLVIGTGAASLGSTINAAAACF